MTTEIPEPKYVVWNGWLTIDIGSHTCGWGGYGEPHEPHCGLEPVAEIKDIERIFKPGMTARYEEALRWMIGRFDQGLLEVLEKDEITGKDHFPELAREFENRVNSDEV